MDRSLRLTCGIVLAVAAVFPGVIRSHASPATIPPQIFAPVLIYHHVKPLKRTDDAIERGLTVLPSQFAAQLRYLRTAGYHPVTALQLIQHLRMGSSLPSKPVVMTFDDGYSDMFQDVYQPLLRAHLGGTFFIVPSFVGTSRYLTWRQLQIMAAHGMDIEAHTMTHPDLTRIGPRGLRWQLGECRRELQARLRRSVRLFAYPYGAYSLDVIAAVSRAGYHAAFTTREGWVASSAHALTEPRVYVDVDDTIAIFAGRVRGDSRILAADPT